MFAKVNVPMIYLVLVLLIVYRQVSVLRETIMFRSNSPSLRNV